jgi:hypothetical protein
MSTEENRWSDIDVCVLRTLLAGAALPHVICLSQPSFALALLCFAGAALALFASHMA